jgi:hypothetical protein
MANIASGVWRALIITHRYLGVAVSVLMVMWFASGVVMMYVGFPHVTEDQRIRALAPISWSACCRFGEGLIADDDHVLRAQMESLAGVPVMRLRRFGRPDTSVDLQEGAVIRVEAGRAQAIARDAARRVIGQAANPVLAEQAYADQWTIGRLDRDRPLFRFGFDDLERTNIYVSGTTGQVVHWTTKTQRFWNWLGAIPHWMYFIDLRSNPALWSKFVIWTSILGTFLTLIGLYVGIAQFCGVGRAGAPYHGAFYWHHMTGLVFGLVTLTWVVSGLISMNPWGFLESGRGADEQTRIEGQPIKWGEIRASLDAVRGRPDMVNAMSLVTASFDGRLYWLATQIDGKVIRLDATGDVASVSKVDLERAAQRIAQTADIAEQGMLYQEDAYYFRGRDTFVLPVYRVILRDEDSTRYYIDPSTGSLLQRVDTNSRWYRWLFGGLHRFDFMPSMRARPVWDMIVIIMLLGGLVLTTTGFCLAVRRVCNDAVALFRLAATRGTVPQPTPAKGDAIDV